MYGNKVGMEETQEYNYPTSIALYYIYTSLLIPISSSTLAIGQLSKLVRCRMQKNVQKQGRMEETQEYNYPTSIALYIYTSLLIPIN